MHNDLMDYPPMISLIDIMKELGEDIVYIGHYTESPTTQRFEQMGIKLIKLGCIRTDSDIDNLKIYNRYRQHLSMELDNLKLSQTDTIWYVYSQTANFVHNIISRYRYVIHFFEYTAIQNSWKFRLLYPSFNQAKFIKNAVGIIHCEDTRGQIFRALYGLDNSPYIIPNKPYVKNQLMSESKMPEDVRELIGDVQKKIKGKKVILYQGFFASVERRLEEFCQAVNMMPSEYVMIAMGKGPRGYFDNLKMRYESEKIIFIPFILPPYHLHVTEMASIGVMSYSPHKKTHAGIINALFCAPNKIFEYGKYGKPMIANNVPALKNIFEKYHCGEIVDYPITPEAIVGALEKLFADYDTYSKGSLSYYESVDLFSIVKNILAKIR